jgi:anthranilate synthase component 1
MKTKLYTSYKKVLADMHTPVSIYLKLRDHYMGSILLESSEYQSKENSYSYICCNPISTFKVTNSTIETLNIKGESTIIKNEKEVFASELSNFINNFDSNELDLPFCYNGVFGYTSYDSIEFAEYLTFNQKENEDKSIPLVLFSVYEYVFVMDQYSNELFLIQNATSDKKPDYSILELLNNTTPNKFPFSKIKNETSNFTDNEYEEIVKKGIAHCKRGDVFQIVLSREFKQAFKGDDFNVYRALRMVNPSPYLFHFDYVNFKLFGSSPEAQLRINDNVAEIHPIAGTYKRTGYLEEDQALAEQLLLDPKENAEHMMLVDLARNDLSRNTKEVTVEKLSEIQFYSHVIHMVSKVTGKLDEKSDNINVYYDSFPAGTLSGAPKYKAMTLIDQYENRKRSFYGGAIGYIGFNGDVNMAIMIRTFLSKNDHLVYQAGAGVVVNSDPSNEREEINNKIGALRKAINIAEEI